MRQKISRVNRGGYGPSITDREPIQPSRLFNFAKRNRKTIATTARASAAGDRTANNAIHYNPLQEPLQKPLQAENCQKPLDFRAV
jgi:hypothetical protein